MLGKHFSIIRHLSLPSRHTKKSHAVQWDHKLAHLPSSRHCIKLIKRWLRAKIQMERSRLLDSCSWRGSGRRNADADAQDYIEGFVCTLHTRYTKHKYFCQDWSPAITVDGIQCYCCSRLLVTEGSRAWLLSSSPLILSFYSLLRDSGICIDMHTQNTQGRILLE